MQILHPFVGSIQEYGGEIAGPSRYRPDHCPQCHAAQGLTAHGFYRRTLVDAGFDGSIRVRRYLCRLCRRTVSLLPQLALPYLRFSVTGIALCFGDPAAAWVHLGCSRKLHFDNSNPKEVRRRILEASVRAPEEWHQNAIRAAYSSGDKEWILTAVFSMRWVCGFDDQIPASRISART